MTATEQPAVITSCTNCGSSLTPCKCVVDPDVIKRMADLLKGRDAPVTMTMNPADKAAAEQPAEEPVYFGITHMGASAVGTTAVKLAEPATRKDAETEAPAQSEPDEDGMPDVIKYLLGEGDLEGFHYPDYPDMGERYKCRYWWRKALREAWRNRRG